MFKLVTFLTAAVLAASVSASEIPIKPMEETEPAPCGLSVAIHEFVGQPGTIISHGGNRYEIPAHGAIEVESRDDVNTYQAHGRSLPLKVFPRDAECRERIRVPSLQAIRESDRRAGRDVPDPEQQPAGR